MKDQLEYNNIFDAIASSPEEAAKMKAESDRLIKEREITLEAMKEARRGLQSFATVEDLMADLKDTVE